ncbi:MAG: MBL fold metallo-hydrolase [Candidatus Dormibacteria bacterium]
MNSFLVVGDESALLVDTGCSPVNGRRLRARVQSLTSRPLLVVNTHAHWDHCFGNAAFDPMLIWGHRLCASSLRATGEEQKRTVAASLMAAQPTLAEEVATAPIVLPNELVDVEAEISLGQLEVHLIHPGPAHTDHDLAVWVPAHRVLIAGDILEEGGPPSFEDSYPIHWPEALSQLLALDPVLLLPGHGRPVGMSFARTQLADLTTLARHCLHAIGPDDSSIGPGGAMPFPAESVALAQSRARAEVAGWQAGAEMPRPRSRAWSDTAIGPRS